jgi:UDP-2,4-diacetamido-2,4,6-trideoxy-beta-L-altropyranose hydrolase
MRFLCRTDASIEIGTGHVVRCATLALHLVDAGHEFQFICRELPGDLNRWLERQGFYVHRLHAEHAEEADAAACRNAVAGHRYDWIIVDHYGLSAVWERAMAALAGQLFVIDDLGRSHECQLLLDPNYSNPMHERYRMGGAGDCELLLGPAFALLRPEFVNLRAESISRQRAAISRLLVFMGGSDPSNETEKVLNGIARAQCADLTVDVVIGAGNPHRRAVERACAGLRRVHLHVQTSRMAELMAAADGAVCGAGNATWECCTLGLPSLATIMARNQEANAEALAAAGAHQLLGWHDILVPDDYARALSALDSEKLGRMSKAGARLCDGGGTARVAAHLSAWQDRLRDFPGNARGR